MQPNQQAQQLVQQHGLGGALAQISHRSLPSPDKEILVAEVFLNAGAVEEALTVLDQLVQQYPQQSDFLYRRALCHQAHHQPERGLRDLNGAIQLSPGQAELFELRAQLWEDIGELERAQQDLNRLQQLGGGGGCLQQARLALKSQRPEECLESLRDRESTPQVEHLRALACQSLGKWELSLIHLEKAQQLGMSQDELWEPSAQAQSRLGQSQLAVQTWHKVLKSRNLAKIWIAYAVELWRCQQLEEARQALQQALLLDPTSESHIRRQGYQLAALVLPRSQQTCRSEIEKALHEVYPEVPAWWIDQDPVLDSLRGWSQPGYWHVIALGLSELDHKNSALLERSGLGLELSLKTPHSPHLASAVLREAARALKRLGRPPRAQEAIQLTTPFGSIQAVGFVPDPLWPQPLTTSFGRVAIKRLVGLTLKEAEIAAQDGLASLLERWTPDQEPRIFEQHRSCLTQQGLSIQTPYRQRLPLDRLAWECPSSSEGTLILSSKGVVTLKQALTQSLDPEVQLASGGDPLSRQQASTLILSLGPELDFQEEAGLLKLTLPKRVKERIDQELQARIGSYWFSPGLTIKVVAEPQD